MTRQEINDAALAWAMEDKAHRTTICFMAESDNGKHLVSQSTSGTNGNVIDILASVFAENTELRKLFEMAIDFSRLAPLNNNIPSA
jgi:hypothetical protein